MGGLTGAWVRAWSERPRALALESPLEGLSWTAAELEDRSARAAGMLAAHGVGAGDRVLISAAPSAAMVASYAAILRLGAVVVPANTAATRRELDHVVETAEPVAAVLDDPRRLDLPVRLRPGDLAGARGPRPDRLDAAGGGDPAMLAFTSGTTGRPKAAVLSHGNLRAGAEAVVQAWEWSPDDRLLLTLPLFHMHGLGVGVNGSLQAGAGLVVVPSFDPGTVGRLAATGLPPTLFFGVPTMYARLLESGDAPALSPLRLLVSGSAPLPPHLFEAVQAATGQAPLERYGMTETVMLAGNPLHGRRRPGSVGLPMPGVRLRLDPDTGEVQVRGRSVFSGYLDRPEATAAAFTADGWFRTGDVGRLDDDGYLVLVGRTTELIITGGFNVYPREVEEVVRDHPSIRDVAVVGRPDPTWGEVVVAFVTPAGAFDEAALVGHVAARLSPYKRPREWRVVPEVPRNAMGKVRRDVLRDLA